jgi:hypothetical protein
MVVAEPTPIVATIIPPVAIPVHVALPLRANRRLGAEPRSLADDERVTIAHHLRELAVWLAEIARSVANLPLTLLHLLTLLEALLDLVDILVALPCERFGLSLALGAHRIHVRLPLGPARIVELRPSGKLLPLRLHPRLGHERGAL